MDGDMKQLLDEVKAHGITIAEYRGKVVVDGVVPPELLQRLRAVPREELAAAVWSRFGAERATAATKRLLEDRQRWVEECKQNGWYRGPG